MLSDLAADVQPGVSRATSRYVPPRIAGDVVCTVIGSACGSTRPEEQKGATWGGDTRTSAVRFRR